jgi:hypothetical protein
MSPSWLRAANANDLVLPVQIVEPQAGDFPGPQPVSDKQHEDRAVALVDRAIPLNRGHQTQDILAPDALRPQVPRAFLSLMASSMSTILTEAKGISVAVSQSKN